MLFYRKHKDSCEYIILHNQTIKPQPEHTQFFYIHFLYLFMFSLTLLNSPTLFLYPCFI